MKSMNFSKKNDTITLVPNSLKERYEKLFAVDDLKKCKDNKEIDNLMTAVDVKTLEQTFCELKIIFQLLVLFSLGRELINMVIVILKQCKYYHHFRDTKMEKKSQL